MRLTAFALVACLPVTALADDTMGETGHPAGGIMFNTSISLNLPLLSADRDGKIAEEDAYRRGLYARTVGECAALLETIAKSCVVTSVSVSTQINSNPGQADYLYASANIAMQVELK